MSMVLSRTTRWTKRNAIGRERATISCYIAGVRDAISVEEFYYLWVVIENDAGAFVLMGRKEFSHESVAHGP